MWGIIPSAGLGSRIQPLAFSKELLPVGSRCAHGSERPKAVSEYVVERMLLAGVDKLCFVISPGKSDIVEYFGASVGGAQVVYVVQPNAVGLCDAIFRALPLVSPKERVLVGLPDTVWFPEHGYRLIDDPDISLLLFPVDRPELFDSVITDPDGSVREVQVKTAHPQSNWIWGAFQLRGHQLRALFELWYARGQSDPYMGTLFNAYLAAGERIAAVRGGEAYVDVGTLDGYRQAIRLLERTPPALEDAAFSELLLGHEVGHAG